MTGGTGLSPAPQKAEHEVFIAKVDDSVTPFYFNQQETQTKRRLVCAHATDRGANVLTHSSPWRPERPRGGHPDHRGVTDFRRYNAITIIHICQRCPVHVHPN